MAIRLQTTPNYDATGSALGLGSEIDGTAAIFVVCARPVQANANVGAIVQWRELL